MVSLRRAGERVKGGVLFREREHPLWNPQRKAFFHCKQAARRGAMFADATSCARRSRVAVAIRFASASIIRCRSAHLVEVRSNLRLPRHSSMRRALAMPHSAGSLSPCKRHSRLTIVRRGCNMQRNAGVHGEAMYTALTLRSACSSSSCSLAMAGSRGRAPCVLLGVQGGHSLT